MVATDRSSTTSRGDAREAQDDVVEWDTIAPSAVDAVIRGPAATP